jgi:hypothetical protein
MSRTIDTCVASLAFATAAALGSHSAMAQTLGDLAQAQRAKQQIEVLKSQKELADAESAAAAKLTSGQPPKVSPGDAQAVQQDSVAARPRVVLHSLYSRNNIWVAELASGQGLALALVGMQIYGNRIAAIDQRGLVMSKPCTAEHVRDKVSCGQRVVAVGESI